MHLVTKDLDLLRPSVLACKEGQLPIVFYGFFGVAIVDYNGGAVCICRRGDASLLSGSVD